LRRSGAEAACKVSALRWRILNVCVVDPDERLFAVVHPQKLFTWHEPAA
jgi:hypothetical protein